MGVIKSCDFDAQPQEAVLVTSQPWLWSYAVSKQLLSRLHKPVDDESYRCKVDVTRVLATNSKPRGPCQSMQMTGHSTFHLMMLICVDFELRHNAVTGALQGMVITSW